jgi:hypothetical protein
MNEKLTQAITPIVESQLSLQEQRMALHEMFALAMSNIPENETDNFTAKKLAPAYLALCQFLENLEGVILK